jgi:hypothetical protein
MNISIVVPAFHKPKPKFLTFGRAVASVIITNSTAGSETK